MKVFLGSSSESLDHLGEIAMWLESSGIEPVPWNLPTLFLPGDNTLQKLIEISKQVDAAVFVFAEDDKVWYRADTFTQPRDNVLLEYGLFVGALGPKRAIICRRGRPRAATDLQGTNWVDSSPGSTQKAQAQAQLKAWVQEILRTRAREGAPESRVARDVSGIERTRAGLKTAFRSTDIFVDFGVLQNMDVQGESTVVVLPANEFFDERCFEDVRTAAGAFIQRHFPTRARDLQRLVRHKLSGAAKEPVERSGRPALQSYGVGTCVYLDHPLGASLRLIFAAVATDRPPDGLRTDLSTIFKVIERIRCIVAEERIATVYLPLLGAGKGGVAADVAFHTLVHALFEARCQGGGHHLRDVHIIVYASDDRPPQLDDSRAEFHLEQLLTLYRGASL
ncbi:MAG TPA: TIR domain-containing protein [Terriglobia bacterium]|nr:TIR domain-containing protein [Terriglobia bacterium]